VAETVLVLAFLSVHIKICLGDRTQIELAPIMIFHTELENTAESSAATVAATVNFELYFANVNEP
jgi:hypothetical protein